MIANIIVAIVLFVAMTALMYGVFEGIREKDDRLTLICSTSASLVGLLCGFLLGFICF